MQSNTTFDPILLLLVLGVPALVAGAFGDLDFLVNF